MLHLLKASFKSLVRFNKGKAPLVAQKNTEQSLNREKRDHFFRLANEAMKQGEFASAQSCYQQAIAMLPNDAAGHIGLGFVQLQTRQLADAIGTLRIATELNPDSADGHYMLGKAYLEQGALDLADKAWCKSLQISKAIEIIYCDYCLLLFNHGKIAQARQVINFGAENFPENADIHFFCGNIALGDGDLVAALTSYQSSLALNEDSPFVLSNYGTALRQAGRLKESLAAITKALLLAPDAHTIFSNYLLGIQYSANFSKQERFNAHTEFSKRFEVPVVSSWGGYENSLTTDRKIRIGYVSGDFRNHSLVFFIEPILRTHDRANFEIYCYYNYPVNDAITERLIAQANQWINCSRMSDDELAKKIRDDKIDVLIDLSGHTGHNRLLTFARKPAPVQLTWLGYQATTGLKAVDFRITDEALDPTGTSEEFHSERLLRLVAGGTFAPAVDSPVVGPLPCLQGKLFTFGCLNNPSKITERVVITWSKILHECSQTRLLIGNSTTDMQLTVTRQFEQNGITANRIVFRAKVSLIDYLALHNEIDLALDTFPYNGGTTTLHSLWMGVPIIALKGDTALSNVGTSIMGGLNLKQFCAEDAEDYIGKAVYFAINPDELSAVRQSLRAQMTEMTSTLTVAVTDSLEQSLQKCWIDFCYKENKKQTAPA